MANDIYGSFTKCGAKSYLLLNRVGGYCVPNTLIIPHNDRSEGTIALPQYDEADLSRTLCNEVSMDLISAIPCY
jgi:chromosome partitioning protein